MLIKKTLIFSISIVFIAGALIRNNGTHISDPSIIIIGSGAAGLAAATKLLKNNFTNIKIFEAENRIGGRINSVIFGDAYIDLGAEYCQGEVDNIVYSLAKDFNILQHDHWYKNDDKNETRCFHSNGNIISLDTYEKMDQFANSFELYNEPITFCPNSISVGECLENQKYEFYRTATNPNESEIFQDSIDWVTSYICSDYSPFDLYDLSIVFKYKACEGDLALNWNGLGYKTILEIMMRKYPNPKNQLPIDDKIYLNKEVINIKNYQNERTVTVTTIDGLEYEVDHVIFTPSLGVLKMNHRTLFNPQLPTEKIKAIENIGFDAIMKVILHFPEKWWNGFADWVFIWTEKDKQGLKALNLEWLITLTNTQEGEMNEKVIIFWYAGSYIPYMEKLSDAEILRGHRYLINTFLAPHYHTVIMPDKMLRTSWHSNRYYRGTYSYTSVKGNLTGDDNLAEKLASPIINEQGKPLVLFAGEATHPYYFSTVHGAIESGYREAERLITIYT